MPGAGCDVYLKQVEMENFKSFGGKLIVPLMEGYTAITGPNGSGKSNITDAILFVLGPKSSKAVRAGRLTDLIFDGGKTKNKASFMTVSLVFDNSDRMMPWDDDIVRLTRMVRFNDAKTDYYSYFYVNDRKSAMSEFEDLLTKARISADGYNLVQQGDVTKIVQMGTVERRRILDGISGIASFDQDIENAAVERSEAETNLDRINIVLEELENQIRQLEKDREDARKYLDAQSRLEMSKAQLTHRQMQIEESKREGFQNQIRQLDEEIAKLRERKLQIRSEYAENENAIVRKDEEISAKVGPEYKELKGRIEAVKIKIATQKARIESIQEDISGQVAYRESIEESISENENTSKDLNNSLDDVKIAIEQAEEKLVPAKAEDEKIRRQMAEHGGEHTELQNALAELEDKIDSKGAEEHEAQVAAAKAESLAEEGARALASMDERIQSASFDIKDAEWNLQQVKQENGAPTVEEFSRKILEAKRKEAEMERQESELNDAIRRLDSEYGRLSAEKKVSENMNRGSTAVSAILALRDKRKMAGIHGTVQELATVDQQYETAVSVAAGGKMTAVVVDDDEVAAEAISFLKSNKLGRVTFLPLTKMIGGKPRAKAIMAVKSSEGYAIDLIKFDPRYQDVFWYVMGDTLVMKDLGAARAIMGGIRMVTMQGELIEASGAMVGGTLRQDAVMKFGASSESDLEEVGRKLGEANDALDALRGQMRAVREEIRRLDDEMRKANAQGMDAQSKIGGLRAQISELNKARKTLLDEFEEKKSQCARRDAELEAAKVLLSKASAELESLRAKRTKIRERIKEIAPAELQEHIQNVRDRIYALNGELSGHRDEKNALEAEIAGLGKQTESLRKQLENAMLKIRENEDCVARYESSLKESQTEIDVLRGIESKMETGIEGLRNQRDALMENRYRLDGESGSVQEKIEVKEGTASSMNASIIGIDENIARLREEMAQIDFEVEMPVPSEEEIRRTIRSCETTMSRIGNVNLRAIEDYDEKKKRYDGLSEEVGRLKHHIKELTDLTESLNGQKKGLFMGAYEAIGENFREIYAKLSGGGEAFIGLESEEDPFLGGLSINAKPKNGKLLRLEALSGGEKSLTALAFIFAIQEYQPSPFYVLDEVDMFLDAVNAEMVAGRVRESSAKAQFIQVSLRKVTLAMADHLIGVTRPPSGVSKIIIQPDFAEVSRYEDDAVKAQGPTGE